MKEITQRKISQAYECSPHCEGFDQIIQIIEEIDSENKNLIDELSIAKSYLELAMDRADPYVPIVLCLNRLNFILNQQNKNLNK